MSIQNSYFHFIFSFALLTASCAHNPSPRVSSVLPVIAFADLGISPPSPGPSRLPAATPSDSKTYLGIDLDVTPYAALLKHLEKVEKVQLQSRGEAHITVLTPPEFKVLTQKLKPQQIHALAAQLSLESAPFRALCAGKGKVASDRTYFVVVSSEKIFQFRQELQKLFEKKGGPKGAFDADHYYPHVTLGFTSRDLHEHEGVIKDERSCFYIFDEQTENLLSSKIR